jgi:acyl carrier protein
MLTTEQLERLAEVFRTLFNMPDLEIKDTLSAKDVPSWDSFNHINLIINIEEEFGTRFTHDEVSSMEQVGDLKKLLAVKISK